MGTSAPGNQKRAAHGNTMRGGAGIPTAGLPEIVDLLSDSFPLLPGESQWLAALMADELARILADD
jgi:hypothetical protein